MGRERPSWGIEACQRKSVEDSMFSKIFYFDLDNGTLLVIYGDDGISAPIGPLVMVGMDAKQDWKHDEPPKRER